MPGAALVLKTTDEAVSTPVWSQTNHLRAAQVGVCKHWHVVSHGLEVILRLVDVGLHAEEVVIKLNVQRPLVLLLVHFTDDSHHHVHPDEEYNEQQQ